MFVNLLRIHHNYLLDYKEVMRMDMMSKMISRKYTNNKYIHQIYLI